jgi:predicted thioesterase
MYCWHKYRSKKLQMNGCSSAVILTFYILGSFEDACLDITQRLDAENQECGTDYKISHH